MAKKQTTKRQRTANFPLVFWEGLRERCQDVADAEFGGNLTTYLNTTVLADMRKRKGAKAKK